MTITIPMFRSEEHKSWHCFINGGCWQCGYHCDDCPVGVATCKCPSGEDRADKFLRLESARITSEWYEI